MHTRRKITEFNRAVFFACALFIASALIGLTSLVSATAFAQNSQSQPVDALEGLDPVLLTQGKEVQGELKIAVVRGRFRYLFASEENKAVFEKDPARYEIQLEGHCARMGPPVGSNPDLFTVHQGRIYVFGSGERKKLFEAAPEKYLEPAPPGINATPAAIRKGRELIEKAVAALGGATKIDGMVSFQETGLATETTRQGEAQFKTTVAKISSGKYHREEQRSFGTLTDVIMPGDSFSTFRRGSRVNVQQMSALQRAEIKKRFKRDPLEALRARASADFTVAAIGSGKVGEAAVEQVAVKFEGVHLRLGIDAKSGRVLSLSYRGRNQGNGEVGEIELIFSDFRDVGGLTLPFKRSGTFNGQPDPRLSFTAESITVNGKIDPALFEKPKANDAQ
jgi:YHS domain-containing protein